MWMSEDCADFVFLTYDKHLPSCSLTSSWWTDEKGDAVQEIHHGQCQRQVPSSHQVGGHHGDQGHIGTVKVTIENSEGHKEHEGLQQWHKEAAEAFHHHREGVAYQAVGLQIPKGAQTERYPRGNRLQWNISVIKLVQRSAVAIPWKERRLVLPVS